MLWYTTQLVDPSLPDERAHKGKPKIRGVPLSSAVSPPSPPSIARKRKPLFVLYSALQRYWTMRSLGGMDAPLEGPR